MSREEKVNWIIDAGKCIGEEYTVEELNCLTDSELDQEFDWLDYLLDK